MKKVKKYILLVGFIFLVGCSTTDDKNQTSSGSTEIKDSEAETVVDEPEAEDKETQEIVTLDWYINYSWFDTKWGSDVVSKSITDKTGVKINFITPKGTETNTLHTLLTSDDIPDIITLGAWEPQIDQLIVQDKVYAYNELNEQYDGDFWEVANQEVCKWNKKEDGNIYTYPNSFLTPQDYKENHNVASNQTFLVRRDIYEAIGSPDMTTPEGFMDAVREATRLYPEVNGKPLIPIGAHQFDAFGNVSFDKYLQNFLAIPYEKDGKYYDRYTDPEYIEWLKVFRQLAEEGYLKDEIFTDQRIQMEEKQAQGQYFCMLYQRTDIEDQQFILYNKNPESVYIAIDGPKNSKGEDHRLPGTGITGWTTTMIAKDSKYPEKALELITYMMSEEGQLLTTMGIEGITFDWVEGQAIFRDEVKEVLYTDRVAFNKMYGADNTYWMLKSEAIFLKWRPPLEEPVKQMEEWTLPYTEYLDQYTLTYEGDTEIQRIDDSIEQLWGDTLVKLLLAESEEAFDVIMLDFIKQRNDLGYDKLIEASTQEIQSNKYKLGIQ